jgi:hypothetical protein
MLNTYTYHQLPPERSVFVTLSSQKLLSYLPKHYILFAMLLHSLCFKMYNIHFFF